MALNPGLVLRSASPASSDGSPQHGRREAKQHDAESLGKDKNFRRYAAGVDRALGLFDGTLQEWADYISFLSRLLKALHNHPQGVNVVPRKFIVAQRLAQCLHPSLPSGVHQKALEVYTFLFAFIGQNGLAEDLGVYLPGIASTLTFASVAARPRFLSLIEEYVLKIPIRALRPALKALILALLPGLEEETSDEFEKTLQILNQCKQAFGSVGAGEVFWQNLFLASITSPSRRQGILVYLTRYLPKLGIALPDEANHTEDKLFKSTDVAAVTTPEPGLLLRCFATGLADEQTLVQRAFLDLLVTHLPLHASVFRRQVATEDLELLLSAAVGVVLRRDMSLNRRLWSWFLGPELTQNSKSVDSSSVTDCSPQTKIQKGLDLSNGPTYFQTYSVQPLVRSLEAMIAHDSQVPSRVARPFRIALSLMDRWEIGSPAVNAVFLPLLRSLREYQESATSKEDFEEVFRSANVFFDGVESSLIWSKMLHLVIPDGKGKQDILRDLDLATFVIANFNVREEEMIVLHLPLVSLAMLYNLSQAERRLSDHKSHPTDCEVVSAMFRLLNLMIDIIPDRAFTRQSNGVAKSGANRLKDDGPGEIQAKVELFFDHNHDSVELSEAPFSAEILGETFLQSLSPMIFKQLQSDLGGFELSYRVQTMSLLLGKLPSYKGLDGSFLLRTLRQRLDISGPSIGELPFRLLSSATALFVSLFIRDSQHGIIELGETFTTVPLLVRHIWAYLAFSSPQHHIEAVHLLQDLHKVVWEEELVTSTILRLVVGANLVTDQSYSPSKEDLERYTILWTHTHSSSSVMAPPKLGVPSPLDAANKRNSESAASFSSMLNHSMRHVLTVLRGPQTEVYASCRDWLQSLPDLSSIFEVIVTPIRISLGLNSITSFSTDNAEVCCDMMEILNQVVALQSKEQWVRFSTDSGSDTHHLPFSESKDPERHLLQAYVTRICREIVLQYGLRNARATDPQILRLQRITLSLLRKLFSSPKHEPLLKFQVDSLLVAQLDRSVALHSRLLQSDLLDTLLLILNSKIVIRKAHEAKLLASPDEGLSEAQIKTNVAVLVPENETLSGQEIPSLEILEPPDELLKCLLNGIASSPTQEVIHKWIQVICESTDLYKAPMFNVMMKIVECFCGEIRCCFDGMKAQYHRQSSTARNFETPLLHLLNGLDFILAKAHEQLLTEEEGFSTISSPEPQQGFFGNMVSGALSSDTKQARNKPNNSRLAVILCFQDALRTCFTLWSWQSLEAGDSSDTLASFHHASQKIRSRSRRILEHLLAAEPVEATEALAHIWVHAFAVKDTMKAESLLNLVHTLEGSRPGITVATVFNAIYSRTNSISLEMSQRSTLSIDLLESDLVAFLCAYTHSLEDDVLEEIWKGCTSFLRDVLSNPMPHRQILVRLVKFTAILGAKMNNTNFGEERKMRKELADLFVRLLTAIFTIKPQSSSRVKIAGTFVESDQTTGMPADSIEQSLDQNFVAFLALLDESDRFVTVMVNVVSSIIAPMLRSRQFPQNLTPTTLNLLLKISKVQNGSKAWKKEITDAFNDARIFSSPMLLVEDGWLPLVRQLSLAEKALLPELLSRLSPPTSAGIMFGVGATAARLEADKKAQLNLRRVCCVLLAVENDTFAAHVGMLQTKLEELLTASAVSSPSSLTRAEVFMVIRALLLKSSLSQMATFWPMINTELRAAFSSISLDSGDPASSTYSGFSLLQAAKLLDVLLLISPEDFQPQQWLFVTDTVDAIYRPEEWEPTALVDAVAQNMMKSVVSKSANTPSSGRNALAFPDENDHNLRRPWLRGEQTRGLAEMDIRDNLLRPFFGQLSIHVYERTYSLFEPDLAACKDDLLADVFDDSTVVAS